jgi:hypothetical protein
LVGSQSEVAQVALVLGQVALQQLPVPARPQWSEVHWSFWPQGPKTVCGMHPPASLSQ